MKALLILTAVISAVVGIAAPWAAPRVAALMVVLVAVAYASSRLHTITARLPAADERSLRSLPPPRPGTPADLTLLTAELRTAKPTNVLSPAVSDCLRDLAAIRLKDRHELDVRDPFTHTAIRTLVTDDLWAVLTRSRSAPYRLIESHSTMPRYRSLPALIDEVERL